MYRKPATDCRLCPRLAEFRDENREKFPDKFNAPVPGFGPDDPELLIVGLAPGLKGANFTGRPFTGDYAGDFLYDMLVDYGFAKGVYDRRPDDGLELIGARITNGVKCVPPQNKPVGAEINACRDFLESEIAAYRNLKAIIALGTIAHNTLLRALGHKQSAFKFGHAAIHEIAPEKTLDYPVTLIDSYHCSRYNTNTGRLTEDMFRNIFEIAAKLCGRAPDSQAASS